MFNLKAVVVLTALAGTLFFSCTKESSTPAATTTPSLYTRLGEKAAIEAVVDQLIAEILVDTVINRSFAPTVADPVKATALRTNLVNQICQGSGGPCVYTGKTMLESHKGMNITEAQFNALVADLGKAMTKKGVKTQEQNDLIAILAPMKSDIVGR